MHPAAALFDAQYRSFVVVSVALTSAVCLAANKRLISFDVAFQYFEAISLSISFLIC